MNNELEDAIQAARKAGEEVLKIYNTDFKIEYKGKEPLTQADLISQKIIFSYLEKYDYGIISEENKDDEQRLGKDKVWIIDSLDGTSDFVNKIGDFSIMIGLVHKGEPVLGVVYSPTEDKLYYAEKGKGSYLGDRRLNVSNVSSISESRFLFSRHHFTDELKEFADKNSIKVIHKGSIGLKLGLIAEAKAEAMINLSDKTCQWDTCAPEIILREAGGDITDLQGNRFRYNRKQLNNPNGIIASNGKIHEQIIKSI